MSVTPNNIWNLNLKGFAQESMGRVGIALSPHLRAVDAAYADAAAIAVLVREAFRQGGLGMRDAEAPLADIIEPGMTVLLKPNWVVHYNYGGHGMDCMVTHPSVIHAVLGEVAKARPDRIILGDAPIQSCDWTSLVTDDLQRELQRIARPCKLEIVDFRRTILSQGNLRAGVRKEQRSASRYVLFDLGRDSLLEPVSIPEGRFRVTWYDPDELAKTHRPGRHQYLLCREAFEADVILNLPKLKTHRKAGITAALKNLVGLNGAKDYLPHHRVGGTSWGGDCYPGRAPLKRIAERLLDASNRRIGSEANRVWSDSASRLIGLHARLGGDAEVEGGWHGNDTTWRMALDLNRILLFGRADGTMAGERQRRCWSLTDGVVCGEGEGPLSPEPRGLGAITFSGSAAAADAAHAVLIGLDPCLIPLTRQAFARTRWPLADTAHSPDEVDIRFQGGSLTIAEAAALGVVARPARGWVGHCEWRRP